MRLSNAEKKSLEAAVQSYEARIDEAAEYLKARGLTRQAAVTRRLGYVAPGSAMVGHDQYEGRLAIPYLTPTGVVDIRFRSLGTDPDVPKYLGRPGVETTMYGVTAFQIDSPFIAVTEGELDAIVLQELVGIPAVGIPGANAWKSFFWRAFEDYDRVFVFGDGDQAGHDFAKRVAHALPQAVITNMPEGHDVNSAYLEFGPEMILEKAGLLDA